MTDQYECDKCGACCRHLIIEVDYIDVLREPRIRNVAEPFKLIEGESFLDENDEPIENPDPYMAGALLMRKDTCACPFVGDDNLCAIYQSRPNVCVAHQAGSEQCQDARESAGLTRLRPIVGAEN